MKNKALDERSYPTLRKAITMLKKLWNATTGLLVAYALIAACVGIVQVVADLIEHFRKHPSQQFN